jgi:hypothetical protein
VQVHRPRTCDIHDQGTTPAGHFLNSRQPPRYSSLAKQNFNYEKRQKEMAKKKKKEEKKQKKLDKAATGPESTEVDDAGVDTEVESDDDSSDDDDDDDDDDEEK